MNLTEFCNGMIREIERPYNAVCNSACKDLVHHMPEEEYSEFVATAHKRLDGLMSENKQ